MYYYLAGTGGIPFFDDIIPTGGDELIHIGMPGYVTHTPLVTLVHLQKRITLQRSFNVCY
jgi:hypothetical protein